MTVTKQQMSLVFGNTVKLQTHHKKHGQTTKTARNKNDPWFFYFDAVLSVLCGGCGGCGCGCGCAWLCAWSWCARGVLVVVACVVWHAEKNTCGVQTHLDMLPVHVETF